MRVSLPCSAVAGGALSGRPALLLRITLLRMVQAGAEQPSGPQGPPESTCFGPLGREVTSDDFPLIFVLDVLRESP